MDKIPPPSSAPSSPSQSLLASVLGSVAFYTIIPLPPLPLSFYRIARFAPGIGLGLGALLGLVDSTLGLGNVPNLLRSAVVVCVWLGLTGGLHLDGAMDTADGLAVMEPERRLAVMSDSRTGAFGVMAAGVILLLKVTALATVEHHRWLILGLVPGWGRWGQVVAIARYPYLKETGKGACHKQDFRSPQDWLGGACGLLSLVLLVGWLFPDSLIPSCYYQGIGLIMALGVPAFFQAKLGGQTGDTYGAIVEWTETLSLVGMAMIQSHL